MRPNAANFTIRVEPQLVEKIDAWRAQQRIPPSRTAAIVCMIEYFLEQDSLPTNAAWRSLLRKA
jgi:hypothetical protein